MINAGFIHPALFSSQSLIGTLGRMLPGKYTNPSIYITFFHFPGLFVLVFFGPLPPPNLNLTRVIPSALFFHPLKTKPAVASFR